jgi:hypothetical protein
MNYKKAKELRIGDTMFNVRQHEIKELVVSGVQFFDKDTLEVEMRSNHKVTVQFPINSSISKSTEYFCDIRPARTQLRKNLAASVEYVQREINKQTEYLKDLIEKIHNAYMHDLIDNLENIPQDAEKNEPYELTI